jgi:hypothetical protein
VQVAAVLRHLNSRRDGALFDEHRQRRTMTFQPHVSPPSADRRFRVPRWERGHTAAWGGLSILAALIIGGLIWFDIGRDARSAASGGSTAAVVQIPPATR